MEYLIVAGFFGGLIALIVWGIKYGKKVNARKQQRFKDFAFKHKLNHSTTKIMFSLLNTVDGELNGIHFQLFEKIEGSGKHQHIVVHIRFNNIPLNFDFKIGKEHFFSKAGKLFGKEDIQMGDEEFDKRFLLKSKSENEFRDLMTYEIQGDLTRLDKDLKASIYSKEGTLSYTIMGGLPNQKSFDSVEKVIDFMFKLMKKRR